MRSGGNSISKTAKLTGCSEAQVKRVWARHQKESGKQEMLSQKLSSATVQKSVAKPSL
ncbi:helix-turn-helix domain-containing protein [Rhizobium giardinii]|uniref:helix-turn-helix domain-containing protein n=1 Tax=Rhizobium giardinii TaxID=56731 RepID=UPI0003A3AC24|nr:helix-turn-helix domain-containing protein [Rhizobium giardinii]